MRRLGIPPDEYAWRQQKAGQARRAPDTIATIVRQGLIEDILFSGDRVEINEKLHRIGVTDRLSEFYRKQPYRRKTIDLLIDAVNNYDAALQKNKALIRLYKKPDGVSEDTIRKDLKTVIRKHKLKPFVK
jgi:hypothetical protein